MKQFELSRSAESLKPSGIRKFFDLAKKYERCYFPRGRRAGFCYPLECKASMYSFFGTRVYVIYSKCRIIGAPSRNSKVSKKQFAVSYDPSDEIIVTVGASQALDVAMRAIINPDDEVLIVEPSFVSYAPLVTLAGGVPVPVETKLENEFKVQPEQIEANYYSENKGDFALFTK